MNRFLLRASLAGAVLLLSLQPARAQDEEHHQTALERQLEHMDFAIQASGQFNKSVSGTNFNGVVATQPPERVTDTPSNTVGALITLRYTRSRWVGFEGNFGYARFTQGYTAASFNNFARPLNPQANADEYSFGYVVHPGTFFGLQTFASAGSGSLAFKPTNGGGEGLPKQARQVYYWEGGAEIPLFDSHFGVRAQFRQQYYLAPDFGQNYLRIKQHTITTQPGFGFYVHF